MTSTLPPHRILLPDVRQQPSPVKPAQVHDNPCDMDIFAWQLFQMIRDSEHQQRAEMHCHPLLQAACRQWISYMFSYQFFDHFHPVCESPNDLLRYLHYSLSPHYPTGPKANNVQSLLGGQVKVKDAYNGFLTSSPHYAHVFGRHEFYAQQTEIGIAHLYIDGGVGGKLAGDHDAVTVFFSAPPLPPRTDKEATWSRPAEGVRY